MFFSGSAQSVILSGMVGTFTVNMIFEIRGNLIEHAKNWYSQDKSDTITELNSDKNLTKENRELKNEEHVGEEPVSSATEHQSEINKNGEHDSIILKQKIKIFNCKLINFDRAMRSNGKVNKISIPMFTRFLSKLKLEGDVVDGRTGFKCPFNEMDSIYIPCECTNFTEIRKLDVVDEVVSLIFHSVVVEFNRKRGLNSNSNLLILPPKYLFNWNMSDILSIIRHMLETDCQELTNILTHLEVIGFLCYIQINKTLKLIYEYLTNLLNNPQMQLAFEDNVHSFIDDLAKRSKFVHINEIEKEETEEESDNHSENVYEAMKDKTINSLKQFGNTLSHSNWVDKFISELGLNCEKDSLTIDKNKLTDFIEDCSIGYYRQIFVGNTLQPILNNIVFEKTKEKEKIIDYYKELKLDYEIRNEININMEYNLQLLEGRLADVNLEIINIVNLMKVVNLDDQNRNNKSNVVVLEHIFQMILLYLMLEPKNYFTLTEYIGRLLLHQ